MSKKIRQVSELPEWFDIRPYEKWEDKELEEATWAVRDRIKFKRILYLRFVKGSERLPDETKKLVLSRLAEMAYEPYRRINYEMFFLIDPYEDPVLAGEEYDESNWNHHGDEREIEEAALVEAKRILIGAPIRDKRGIRRVTLWDVMIWMEKNKEILDEVEKTAQNLAKEKGWHIDEVRSCLRDEIPLWGLDGEDIVMLTGHPTIPAALMAIEKQLLSRSARAAVETARYADVKKLFEYRVAAYVDLMLWSHLTGSKITKKCLANALFPGGEYGEVDMMPSKTVGRFIKRVVEEGYIEGLAAKLAER